MTAHVTTTERDGMVRLYQDQGMTLREVAEATGRGYTTVRRALHRAGIQLRRPGGTAREPGTAPLPPGSRPLPALPGERKRMVEMYRDQHLTIQQIATQLHRATSTVIRALEGEGVPRRKPGPKTIARHWCGLGTGHAPHLGCNGFGYEAGPPSGLCTRQDTHAAHVSCDGRGAAE